MSVSLRHFAVVVLLICLAAIPRSYGQDQKPPAPAASAARPPIEFQAAPPQYQPPAEILGAPPAPSRQMSLAPHYFNARPWFPDLIGPYKGSQVAQPDLKNTPRLEQLIQDGKLTLSLEDAISLALENNLNIEVQRYTPWIDEANLRYAKSGANGFTQFDPMATSNLSWAQSAIPYNTPFLAGAVATANAPIVLNYHTATENFGYTQGFATGTQAQVTFDNSRNSINFGQLDIFNPYFQSTLTVEISQPLLKGFGKPLNTRYIVEGRNTAKIGASQFKQEVMAVVTQVATDYWELVYAREYVKVEEVTVAADQQLYQNNQAEVKIGTMAPVEVITTQSQLASDQQLLVQAQRNEMIEDAALLAAITKDFLKPSLQGIQIVPTTPIYSPTPENLSLQAAVKEALQNRPELLQAGLTLKNDDVEVKATKNALLPNLSLYAEYQAAGLSGVVHPNVPNGAFVGTSPVFATSGSIPTGAIPTGYVGSELTSPGAPIAQGVVSDWNQMIHGTYPTFAAGLNLTLPIRNRAAQAQSAEAQLAQRQQQVAYRNTEQSIILNVREALIAIAEDRAAVAAAKEARIYNQHSYDDEVKQLQLGSSTAFTVDQKQVLLTGAEAVELRDRVSLIEDQLNLDQALGRTLEVHNISIADAMPGGAPHQPEIPGTPDIRVEN